MTRTVRFALALWAVLTTGAAAQDQVRLASPGKYEFSGTVATMNVSGWFEVDVEGRIWLSDGTCAPKRPAATRGGEACTISSVKIRRVKSTTMLDVLVAVLVTAPPDRARVGGQPGPQRHSGTVTARRA